MLGFACGELSRGVLEECSQRSVRGPRYPLLAPCLLLRSVPAPSSELASPRPCLGRGARGSHQRCTVQLLAALRLRLAGAGRQPPGHRAGIIKRPAPATRRPWHCRAARALGRTATTRVAKRDHRSGADGRRARLPSRAPARPYTWGHVAVRRGGGRMCCTHAGGHARPAGRLRAACWLSAGGVLASACGCSDCHGAPRTVGGAPHSA